MWHLNLASRKLKVHLEPTTENIHGIKDDHANTKIGYSHGTIVQKGKT